MTISFNSYALSQNQIASCRQGSMTYNSYATFLDKTLSILLKSFRQGSMEFKEQIKNYTRTHEDFKDKEYLKLLQVQDMLNAEKNRSRESIEVWRMIMESTIDTAYIVVGDNMLNNQLGRTDEHYQRKIYELCITPK